MKLSNLSMYLKLWKFWHSKSWNIDCLRNYLEMSKYISRQWHKVTLNLGVNFRHSIFTQDFSRIDKRAERRSWTIRERHLMVTFNSEALKILQKFFKITSVLIIPEELLVMINSKPTLTHTSIEFSLWTIYRDIQIYLII